MSPYIVAHMPAQYDTTKATHQRYEQFKINGGKVMVTIYEEMIERVSNGERFNVDFEKQNIKVGNTYLMKAGEYDKEKYKLTAIYLNNLDVILECIADLYEHYKYSTPSERSERKRRKYFKALPMEELADEQLIAGATREVAQALLEGFILCHIISGELYWDEEKMGKWFYQGNDPDLIILRKWVENKF